MSATRPYVVTGGGIRAATYHSFRAAREEAIHRLRSFDGLRLSPGGMTVEKHGEPGSLLFFIRDGEIVTVLHGACPWVPVE